MAQDIVFSSSDLAQTDAIGAQIAEQISLPACIYLYGDLGAGKTTLCRAIIAALGYADSVTSPTYNLVHEYVLEQAKILHVDLYRLNDPEELEFLALPDRMGSDSLLLVEWPEKGEGYLPMASHEIRIQAGEAGELLTEREIIFSKL